MNIVRSRFHLFVHLMCFILKSEAETKCFLKSKWICTPTIDRKEQRTPPILLMRMSKLDRLDCQTSVTTPHGLKTETIRMEGTEKFVEISLKPEKALKDCDNVHMYIEGKAIHLEPIEPPSGSFIDIDNVFDENTGWSSEFQSVEINGVQQEKKSVNFDIIHDGITVPKRLLPNLHKGIKFKLVIELRREGGEPKTLIIDRSSTDYGKVYKSRGDFVSIGRDLMEEAGIELFKKGDEYMVRYPGDHVDGQTSQTTEYSL